MRQTIKRLSLLTLYIQKEIQRKVNDERMKVLGLPYTFKEFMFENDKRNSQTIGNIFIDILKRIKGLGNKGISTIIQ